MAKSYRIKVYLDTTDVDAGVRRTQKRVDDATAAAAKMADANAQAVKQVASASAASDQARAASGARVNQQIVEGLKKAAQVQTVTLDQLQGSAKKATDAILASLGRQAVGLNQLQMSGIKLQDALTRDAERGAAERQKIAEREARASEAAAMGPLGRLAAVRRRALTDEQVQSAARNKMIDAENRRRVDAARAAMGAEQQGFVSAIAGATGFTQALTAAGTAMLALDVGKTVAGTIVDNFKLAEKSAYDAGQMVQEYRKSLLELSALKDKLGDTSGAMGEEIAFRAKTLQKASDAREFQGSALGVGESAVDKPGRPALIAKEEFDKAMEYGGAFQAAEGGDAKAHGTLIGLLPQLLGRRTTGAEIAQKEAQLVNIFRPGGPELPSMLNQYAKIAPHVMAKSYDPMQGAALLSAMSTTSGDRSAEEFEQFTRATVGNIDRTGKPRVKGGIPVGKYFERLGVNKEFLEKTKSTDLPFAIANKITEDLTAKEAEAKAQGKEFSREVYLRKQGFANQDDAKALKHYSELKEKGTLDRGFLDLATDKAMPTLEEARAGVVKAQRTEPALQGRKAELATQAAGIASGAGKQEFVTNIERLAFANLKAKGEVSGEFSEDLQNRWSTDPREILFGHRRKTEMEAQRLLLREAARVGVQADAPASVDAKTGERTERFMGVDKLYELGAKVNAAGGSAVPGLEEVTKRAEQQLQESQRFEGTAPGGAEPPPALPLAPPGKGPVQAAMGDKPSAFGGLGWRGLVAASAVGALSGGSPVAGFGPGPVSPPEAPAFGGGAGGQEKGRESVQLLKDLNRTMGDIKQILAKTDPRGTPPPKPLPPRQAPPGTRGRT